MKNLLVRPDIPPSLKPHVWVIRIVLLVALLAIIGLAVFQALNPNFSINLVVGGGVAAIVAVVAAVVGVLWKLLKQPGTRLLTGFLGDAARYFEPKPDNIARRQEIREAGARSDQ